jgi:hypothetical protein
MTSQVSTNMQTLFHVYNAKQLFFFLSAHEIFRRAQEVTIIITVSIVRTIRISIILSELMQYLGVWPSITAAAIFISASQPAFVSFAQNTMIKIESLFLSFFQTADGLKSQEGKLLEKPS